MRSRLQLAALMLAGLAAAASAANTPLPEQTAPAEAGSARARFGMKFDPVKFTPPAVDHAQLANGVSLDFYAEPRLPLVTIMARVGVGSINDPAGKCGAAEMTAQVIRNGGTATLPGDKLDRELEARGATLSASADREATWLTLSVLKEDAAWGMQTLAALLASPVMPAAKLDEARGPRIIELQQRLDVPMDVAQALFPQLVYGKGNPWGATPTEASMKALSIDDLRAMYKTFYCAGNFKLGVSGGIGFTTARALAESTFGKLAPRPFKAPEPPAVAPITKTQVYFVPRDVTQNVIYFGHEGINRFDPRKFPVRVLNNVLAGGFTSRLFQEVRSNRGLAYSVYGRVGEGTRLGVYFNAAMTKAPSTAEALKLMLKINGGLRQAPPKPEEMDIAVQSDVNAFVFFFDQGGKIVQQKITLDANHYPADYLQKYVTNLSAVTPQQVESAAKDLIHLDRLVALVVGKPTPELMSELKKLGPVTEISDGELRKSWL